MDASGDLYVATGNGDFDGVKNFGETILKLSPTLAILDWFAPGNWAALNGGDLDLSSAGVLLVPNSTDVIGAGKEGVMYVLNQTGLGHTQPGDGQIVQTLTPGAQRDPRFAHVLERSHRAMGLRLGRGGLSEGVRVHRFDPPPDSG